MTLEDFKRGCADVALQKLFKSKHFSICTLDDVIKLTNAKPPSDVMDALHALHCVDYGDMPAELQQEVAIRSLQCVSGTGYETQAMQQAIKSAIGGGVVCLEKFKMTKKT